MNQSGGRVMVINRKNDGTVKMTRQRAKPYHSGMTGDANALGRYLEMSGRPTPQRVATKRLHELEQSEPLGTCTTYLRTARVTYKLCFLGNTYWWVKKEPRGTSKSVRYRGRCLSSGRSHTCCGVVSDCCCDVSAPSATVFKLSAAPPPKPAIACTSWAA
jgi:hypothetical protein